MVDKKKIVIIEDDEVDSLRLASFFENEFDVQVIDNGFEGLSIITEQKPDLVLLDIMMPGINGDDVCYNLKKTETTKHIPVIIISSMTEQEYLQNYGSLVADAFLNKHIDREEIISAVKKMI